MEDEEALEEWARRQKQKHNHKYRNKPQVGAVRYLWSLARGSHMTL